MVYEVLKPTTDMFGEKRKAMYDYRCDSCGETIKKGTYYDSACGMSRSSHDYDGDYIPPRYWTFRTHLHHCGVPLRCQMGLHDFKFFEQRGDPDDFFSDYKEEGFFCIYCHQKE